MNQQLKERLARQGPIQAVGLVRSGSPADIVIRPEGALSKVRTVDAIHALLRRGVPPRTAMAAVDTMVETGEALIEVPKVERGPALADEMLAAGVEIRRIAKPQPADVKAIREALGLTCVAFAKRYNLNPRTVQGWEQGRPIDEIANAYLHAIAAEPTAIARSLEKALD